MADFTKNAQTANPSDTAVLNQATDKSTATTTADVSQQIPAASDSSPAVSSDNPPAAPPAPAPKPQTFRGGMAAAGPPSYTVDASGNVVSTQPPTKPTVRGVLGSVLMGALEGATRGAAAQTPKGAKGFGAAASAGAEAARTGAIEADQRAREIAQKNFANQQQLKNDWVKNQQEKALTMKILQDNKFAQEEHPLTMRHQQLANEELETRTGATRQALLQNEADFNMKMADAGLDPVVIESFKQLGANASQVASPETVLTHNGKTGNDAKLNMYRTSDLKGITVPNDVTTPVYTGAIDQNGSPVTTEKLFQKGQASAWDIYQQFLQNRAVLARILESNHMETTKAELDAKKAAANKDDAAAAEDRAKAGLEDTNAAIARRQLEGNPINVFGEQNDMTVLPKDQEKRWEAFNSKTLVPLQTQIDKSYQMANQAFQEYRAANGNLPTGAQSMMMLSQHLSTTFGNVKGARVTKDMIQEHLGARSVSDDALVAIQRLTNGDKLAPSQWAAFNELIGQSREFSYDAAIDNLRSNGLAGHIPGILPRAPKAGQLVDPNTARIYKYAARGNAQKFLAALQLNGWGVTPPAKQ